MNELSGKEHDGVQINATVGFRPVQRIVFSDSMKHVPGGLANLNADAVPKEVKTWRRVYEPNKQLPENLMQKLREAFPTVSAAFPNHDVFALMTKKNICPHGWDGLKEWWSQSSFPPPEAFNLKATDKDYKDGVKAWDVLSHRVPKLNR